MMVRHIAKVYALGRGDFPGGRMARLRAVWHAGVCLYDGEICGLCGRPVGRGIGTWWEAPDDLWMRVNGRFAGVTCPACFHDECATLGIHIHYTATVEQDGCADSDEVAIIPVPTADGGYYVWRARGGEGSASTRAQALRDGRAHLVALGDQDQSA
jgi:hypothetical protein